jgi:hypothetical protein
MTKSIAYSHIIAPFRPLLSPPRVDWTEQQTLTRNYTKNKLVLDPNEGFGRNKSNKSEAPLKSKEERLQEDGETFSDDDGERDIGGPWVLLCFTRWWEPSGRRTSRSRTSCTTRNRRSRKKSRGPWVVLLPT